MPAASSTDYILAGIANIVHVLYLPTANAPIALLSESHTKALHLLMDILHAHVSTDTMDADSLSVAAKNKELNLHTINAKSLRVAAKNKELDLHLPITPATSPLAIPPPSSAMPAPSMALALQPSPVMSPVKQSKLASNSYTTIHHNHYNSPSTDLCFSSNSSLLPDKLATLQ